MRQIVLNRQKFGLEDLAFGTGTEEQLRAGMLVTITKINAGNLPFDETRSLIEWAQDSNIEELGAITAELVSLNNNLGTLNSLAASLTGLNTISSNMSELLLVNDNALAVHNDKLTVASDKSIVAADKALVNTMKLAVENIYDAFDDRFLGVKDTDPTLDNDGNALANGAIYFNSSSSVLKVYATSTTTWYAIPQLYLSSLLDIQLTSLTTGDILTWNGTKWVNITIDNKINLHGRTTKTIPVDEDEIMIADSVSTWSLKKITWANIKTSLISLFTPRVPITTNKAIARYSNITGDLQNSAITIDDSGNIGSGTQSFNGFGGSGFKNYIINGNFDIWQRATSQTTSGYGSDDRWNNTNIGSTKTHSQVACTDTERALFNASYFSRTVVTSVIGASNYVTKLHAIENITKLAGKTVTLSFWAKADSSKSIRLMLGQNFGTGGSPSAPVYGIGGQLVSLTTSWQKKTITITIPSIVGKTLGTDGVHTSSTILWLNFDGGANVTSDYGVSLAQQSGTFDIAQVQLEEGSVATPFENRPYGLELSLCQRYYWSGTLVELAPTRVDFTAQYIKFPVAMRAVPTTVLTAYTSGTVGCLRQQDGSYSTRDQPFTIGCSNETIYMFYSTGAVAVVGAHYTGYITASAEL